jgi:hypothetical protein
MLGWLPAVALLAVGAPANPSVAVLPVVADGVTADTAPRLKRIEETVKRAARDVSSITVQDDARTRIGLASVDEMGIRCDPGAASCLGKIAVLLEADRVIAPIIKLERDKTAVRILVVGPHGEHAEASGDAAVDPSAAELAGLIADAFALPLTGGADPPATSITTPTTPTTPPPTTTPPTTTPPTTTTPTTTTPTPPTTTPPTTTPPAAPPSSRMLTGAAVAGGGALLVALGGAGAVWANLALSKPDDYDTVRVPEMITGQLALGVAALGVAGVVGGCVLVGTAD